MSRQMRKTPKTIGNPTSRDRNSCMQRCIKLVCLGICAGAIYGLYRGQLDPQRNTQPRELPKSSSLERGVIVVAICLALFFTGIMCAFGNATGGITADPWMSAVCTPGVLFVRIVFAFAKH